MIGLGLGVGREIVALRLRRGVGRCRRLGGKRWWLLPDAMLGDLLDSFVGSVLGGSVRKLVGCQLCGLNSRAFGGQLCGEILGLLSCLLGGGFRSLMCGVFGFHTRCLFRSLPGCLFGGLLRCQFLLTGGLSSGDQFSLVFLRLGLLICLGRGFRSRVRGFCSLCSVLCGVSLMRLRLVFSHYLVDAHTHFFTG